MPYILILAGLAGLVLGGELLVRGAVALARRAGLSPLVIGMTIVGFGTSLPELLVSLRAALDGAPGIAIGNVVGSNIANILLILGAAAVISPLRTRFELLRLDLVLVLLATLGLWLILLDGAVSRIDAAILLAALAGFLWNGLSRQAPAPSAPILEPEPAQSAWKAILMVGTGLVALALGAQWLVQGASELARAAGLSEAVIGLTVVAVGTSLPELATSIVAAWRRNADIALGNVVGSNLFNILGILGITALIAPIPAAPRFAATDVPVALAAAVALAFVLWRSGAIGRLIGAGALVTYSAYIVILGTSA
ncbi:calcium/sodium antiporter [Lutimaribacter marinistellae]|uniref:Calcium/sodium antiporter n=1 Tax=Lutimaribacter marinistellae TaxID=1820329 RepID=A0ABV7TKR4_9RHOB